MIIKESKTMTKQTGTVRIGYAYGYVNNRRVRVMYFDYTDRLKNTPPPQTSTQITNKPINYYTN